MTAQFPTPGTVHLTHLGIIDASGEDAATFLHGQLTQDMLSVLPGQSTLAAWCNAKGRMLASFSIKRLANDHFLLITGNDVIENTLKNLLIYVLRAKVKIFDASAQYHIYGVIGSVKPPVPIFPPVVTVALNSVDGQIRTLILDPIAATPSNDLDQNNVQAPQSAIASTTLDPQSWLYAEVLSGVTRITAPVTGSYIPQMLNYDLLEGINFRKGCYPGQEIIARSRYLGTIKRRAWVAQVHSPQGASAGMEIFLSSSPTQSVGSVAQAAAQPQGQASSSPEGHAIIACLPIEAVKSVKSGAATFNLGSAQGPALLDLRSGAGGQHLLD